MIVKIDCDQYIHQLSSAIAMELGIPMNHTDLCPTLVTSENDSAIDQAPLPPGATKHTDGSRWAHLEQSHMISVFCEGHTGEEALEKPFKHGDYGAPLYTLISSIRHGRREDFVQILTAPCTGTRCTDTPSK